MNHNLLHWVPYYYISKLYYFFQQHNTLPVAGWK